MAGGVVVTRPREEALALAEQLTARGYRPLIAPMLEIVALDAKLPPLAGYAGLVFTSANGARAFAARSSWRAGIAYAVGSRTARTLRELGFGDVRDAAGDAEALAMLIGLDPPEGPLLHVSGRAVALDLAALLRPRGVTVDRVALYDAAPVAALPEDLAAALYACTIGHVLFFSARTADIFGTLMQNAGLTDRVGGIVACCLSGPVAAKAAARLRWERVAVADRPNSGALLALLPGAEKTGSHG